MRKYKEPIVYAVKHKKTEIRMASRSGGIFTALSDAILNDGGIIYGVILNDEYKAIHSRATTHEERDRMRGSKYVQSDMSLVLESIREDLQNGKRVLFTGTSCQTASLHAFLGKKYVNLISVDVVCHGVPSPDVWAKYVKFIEKKNGGKCVAVNFRDKENFGWPAHVETLCIKKRNRIKQIHSDLYSQLYYTHTIIRPSCSKCPYKSIIHPADITIADYWGIKKAAPGFYDDKGVSLVLINSELGEHLFHTVTENLIVQRTKIEDSMQPPLKAPYEPPKNRELFWKDYQSLPLEKVLNKYVGSALMRKIKVHEMKLKFFIKKLR